MRTGGRGHVSDDDVPIRDRNALTYFQSVVAWLTNLALIRFPRRSLAPNGSRGEDGQGKKERDRRLHGRYPPCTMAYLVARIILPKLQRSNNAREMLFPKNVVFTLPV